MFHCLCTLHVDITRCQSRDIALHSISSLLSNRLVAEPQIPARSSAALHLSCCRTSTFVPCIAAHCRCKTLSRRLLLHRPPSAVAFRVMLRMLLRKTSETVGDNLIKVVVNGANIWAYSHRHHRQHHCDTHLSIATASFACASVTT